MGAEETESSSGYHQSLCRRSACTKTMGGYVGRTHRNACDVLDLLRCNSACRVLHPSDSLIIHAHAFKPASDVRQYVKVDAPVLCDNDGNVEDRNGREEEVQDACGCSSSTCFS